MALDTCIQAFLALDPSDPDAAPAALRTCTRALLDPTLWQWAIGITLGCAAVGLAIGWVRGRWLAGLVWGAALGPIGWAVVLLSKSGLVECPDCGKSNVPAAKACRHCGVNLAAAAARSERSALKRIDRGRGW
ncbi:zinc ribbon domain-containing protein [Dokdonella sp.]|uniref:zinc ribbon domain-containing protein n=1 Tax=Dokdonella sp. TaxID=2291710 RepID=UPI002F3F05BC